MPCGATQDGWVMVERSARMWSTGEGNGKPLQYSCLENPMNSMKRQMAYRYIKKMLNITNQQGMQIKTTMRYYFIPVRMFTMKKIRDKCWQGHGEKGALVYAW